MDWILFSGFIVLYLLVFAAFAIPHLAFPMVMFALVVLVVIIIPRIMTSIAEISMNKTRSRKAYSVTEAAANLHRQLFIADLHANTLLWNRNILVRHRYGHIDIPRLVEGNIGLQVFSVVTRVVAGQNLESNRADSRDILKPLMVLQGWPLRTWGSPLRRALFQARKLEWFTSRVKGRQLLLIKSWGDVAELMDRRLENPAIIGVMLGLEGAHALEGHLINLDQLFEAGFRIFGTGYFFDNEVCGSTSGVERGGLSVFGREVVKQVEEKKMILDLAHSSLKTIDDILEMASAPVIVSHTGVLGTCDNPHNLADDHIRRIAGCGGVIGISMIGKAVGEVSVEAVARAMRYTSDVGGVDCVSLGTDFDGYATTPIDASGMVQLTDALIEKKFSLEEIDKIMGGNFLRVLQVVLPNDIEEGR
jgi:microsomal dipeptidase-like Zn-dependent dipeptidase